MKLWLGISLVEIGLMLLLQAAGWLHAHFSNDPSVADGYGFAQAFLWVVFSAPWPALAPYEWFDDHFWALFVGGAVLNSLLLAAGITLLRMLWRKVSRA